MVDVVHYLFDLYRGQKTRVKIEFSILKIEAHIKRGQKDMGLGCNWVIG